MVEEGIETLRNRKFPLARLRHTWASWHVQNSTPLQVLKELGGWSSYEMVLKYAHLAPDHLSDYANNLNGIVAKSVASKNITRLKSN